MVMLKHSPHKGETPHKNEIRKIENTNENIRPDVILESTEIRSIEIR